MAQPKTPAQHHDQAAFLLETAREQARQGSTALSERSTAQATAHALLAISGQMLGNATPDPFPSGGNTEGWE